MRRERSKGLIIKSLEKEPKRFKELQSETELSAVGLSDTLKVMKDENMVETILEGRNNKYRLTKEGENVIEKFLYLSYDINAIRSRYGEHRRDYSTIYNTMLASRLPWGIESDLTLDSEIKDLKLLQPKDVIEIEELVFKKIANNLKKKKTKKVEFGKMILGFSIDYNELIKSIEKKSLAYINHISKEEIKLHEKFDGSPDSLTEKEYKRLEKLRNKTYSKIKKLDY